MTVIPFLLILLLIASLENTDAYCTICKDSFVIPLPDAFVTEGQTCRTLGLTAVFYDETTALCAHFRSVALIPCGCATDSPTNTPSWSAQPSYVPTSTPSITTSPTSTRLPSASPIPSNMPSLKPSNEDSCTLCIDGSAVSDEYMNKVVSSMSSSTTCSKMEEKVNDYKVSSIFCAAYQRIADEQCGCTNAPPSQIPTGSPSSSPISPSMVPSTTPTTKAPQPSFSPTSLLEKAPDCDAMVNGEFPDIPENVADFKLFDYTAELILEDGFLIGEDMKTQFETISSRIVSADAAGCYDDNERYLMEQTKLKRVLNLNKVHYVIFT